MNIGERMKKRGYTQSVNLRVALKRASASWRRRTRKSTAGYTLIELVVYIGVLALVIAVFVTVFLNVTASFHTVRAARDVHTSIISAMGRIGHETRQAFQVEVADSTFDTHPGVLKVTVSTGSGNVTREFYLDSGVLKIKEDGVDQGSLTRPGTSVTNLVFRHLTQGEGVAVKIEMTIEGSSGTITRQESFYNTFVLRGSYVSN